MSREQEITENLHHVKERISAASLKVGSNPSEITLIVATKNFPVSDLEILYGLGVRNFGENRDEEAVLKTRQLPSDITWHFQGQIQGRKIRSIVSWADVVHSLDSLDHAQRFDSKISDKTLKFFVQVNVEPHRINRGGVPISKLSQFLENLTTVSRIAPIGLMVVAPQGSPAIDAFNQVKEAKDQLIRTFPNLCALSMGMSSDFEAAIVTGATHLRIGSSILGSRTLTA